MCLQSLEYYGYYYPQYQFRLWQLVLQMQQRIGVFKIGEFIDHLFTTITDVSGNLSKIFTGDYITTFIKTEGFFTLILLFFTAMGLVKSMPKNEYTDIEHGSSDWATGEQYSVLNKKKGILLAENHYLPVDKRGNTNVLVVGRFRFW